MTRDERVPAGVSRAQPRGAGIAVPRIRPAVSVQGRVGDGERVVWGLVAGAVEGGAQYRRHGNTPDYLDLLVPQLKLTTMQADRTGLRGCRLDGNGHSRSRVSERGQRRRGETRVTGDGEVDVRLSRPHRQPLNQGGRCVRQASSGREELVCSDRSRQGDHEPLLPALSTWDGA